MKALIVSSPFRPYNQEPLLVQHERNLSRAGCTIEVAVASNVESSNQISFIPDIANAYDNMELVYYKAVLDYVKKTGPQLLVLTDWYFLPLFDEPLPARKQLLFLEKGPVAKNYKNSIRPKYSWEMLSADSVSASILRTILAKGIAGEIVLFDRLA